MTPCSQAENEEIVATIRSHRSNGRFSEAERLIEGLPKNQRASGSIAIGIIQLFLVQGCSSSAAQICDEAFPRSPLHTECAETTSTIESEEIALFEILRAFVGILRYSKLQTALKTAQRLGSTWKLADDEHLQPTILFNTRALADDSAQLESGSIQSGDVQALEKKDHTLTEYNVLLRFYYWKIQVVAAEQGILDEKTTKAAATQHVSALRRTLQSAGRIREARFLIYFEVNLIADPNRALNELEDFLLLLSEPRWETEKAMTLADIAELQLKHKEEIFVAKAKQSLDEAQRLFSKLDHGFGAIDLDLIRVSADSSTSAGEKFLLKSGIAHRYFQVGHHQNGIRCLASAISPEMVLDRYSEHVVSALELLQRKVVETGSEFLKQVALMHSISQAALKAPEYGFALQNLESYYTNVPNEISPAFHSSMALMLSTIYASFDRHEEALQAAEESLAIAMTGMDYEVQSNAAFMVGIRTFDMSKLCEQDPAKSEKYLNSAGDILATWVDKDAENGYVFGEVQKCFQIGNWDFFNAYQHPERVRASHGQLLIERVRKHIPESADALKRSQLVDLEIKTLLLLEDYPAALKMSQGYLEDVKKIASASPMAKAQAFLSTSIQADLCASNAIKSGKLTSDDAMRSALALIWSSLDLANQALQLYRQTNGAEPIFQCTLLVWDLLSRLATTMEEAQGRTLLRAFMTELNLTERICDDMRRSVVPTKGLASLMNKRLLVAKEESVKLYGIGVKLAMRLDDARGAWEWLQRGKARAFSDSLGPGFLIPLRLMQKINADQGACDLLNAEQSALEALGESGADYVITARRLASVRSRMAENALLAEVSKIRDGMLSLDINTDDINAALSSTGIAPDRVNFVDWSISATDQTGSPITLFVRKLDGETKAKQLSVSLTDVKAWLSKAFEYPELADPPLSKKTGNRLLNTMSGLLDGLSEMTQEDDLLILSPSGFLNRVPLHALSVGGKPLIERNLVVYSPSAALLSQCLNRSNSVSDSPPVRHDAKDETTFFAVFEEPTQAAERSLIFDHVRSLASTFPGSASLGSEVTRPRFLEKVSTSRWVHYHGHARYAHDDVLKASLVLSDGTDLFSEEVDEDKPGLGVDELSVPDLFKARLPLTGGGVNFTVIACDSGTQDYAPGDEPMGLIPALLYAGATSVLGCQWPVLSASGRAFSKTFYGAISPARTQSKNGGSDVIHIAQAMRSTISDMRTGKLGNRYKQPYYWAPFALHGLWFLAR